MPNGYHIACLALLAVALPSAHALQITLGSDTYHYGDYLNVTITVTEVTEQFFSIYISDASGRGGSPIFVPLTGTETVFSSILPFDQITYPAGEYTITAVYAGEVSVAGFVLVDTGEFMVPNWVKEIAAHWLRGQVSTQSYADTFQHIVGPLPAGDDAPLHVPPWVGIATGWWLQQQISDAEYSAMLEYLIRNGIVAGVF